MKRMWICFVVIVLLLSFVSCENAENEEREYYVRKDNELYSDEHLSEYRGRRFYSVSYIVGNNPNLKKAKDKTLLEMKRFVFFEGSVHPYNEGFTYVLDTHSKRIYYGMSDDVSDVFKSEWVVDLQQSDVDRLIAKLTALNVQNWHENEKKSNGREYKVGIEYNDGSVEQHFITGENTNITELLNYFKAECETFKNRMLQDRKTTENIDYLVSYLGWDPSRGSTESFNILRPMPLSVLPAIELDAIDRIVIFEAEGPHEVLDHSRNSQKTLFLDILDGKIYFEPEKAVYEQISKASVVRELEVGEAENIIALLQGGVTDWKANELYYTDEEAHSASKMSYTDIPAWSIGIQYKDGTIVHYSGDGIGENGWAPGSRELLDALFGSIQY